MQQKFQRVIVYARQYRANHDMHVTLHKLIDFLITQKIYTCVDYQTANYINDQIISQLPIMSDDDVGKQNDLMIVIGGDGSLLSAARLATKANTPIIGINRGKLGFLTDILPIELEHTLSAVLNGDYDEEHRCLLEAQIYDKKEIFFTGSALNDVVINRGNGTHLIEFEMYIDKKYVCHYSADGLIIATPTGSTAYALSAGGPIMHPKLNVFTIVPMCSHSLNSRPLVVDADVCVDLIMSKKNDYNLFLSCDGHELRAIEFKQQVCIQKHLKFLKLLHPKHYNYYDTLRSKLSWQFKNHSN